MPRSLSVAAAAHSDLRNRSLATPSRNILANRTTIPSSAFKERQDKEKIDDMLSTIDTILSELGPAQKAKQPFLKLRQELSGLRQLQHKMRSNTQAERSFILPVKIQQLKRDLATLSQNHYKKLAHDLVMMPISQSIRTLTDYYSTTALVNLSMKARTDLDKVVTRKQATDVIHKYTAQLNKIRQGNIDRQQIDRQRRIADQKRKQSHVQLTSTRKRWLDTLSKLEELLDAQQQRSSWRTWSDKTHRDYLRVIRKSIIEKFRPFVINASNPIVKDVDKLLRDTEQKIKVLATMRDDNSRYEVIVYILLVLALLSAGFLLVVPHAQQGERLNTQTQARQVQQSIHRTHPDIRKLYQEANKKNWRTKSIVKKADAINNANLDDIPDEYECPLTRNLLIVPLKIGDFPYCFEAKELINWLKIRKINPMTNEPIKGSLPDVFHVDEELRQKIWEYIDETYKKLQ